MSRGIFFEVEVGPIKLDFYFYHYASLRPSSAVHPPPASALLLQVQRRLRLLAA
jgi:hypothetical protein